ncbi:MAG: hypothetical protein IT299_01270 [Dehalococcoidia bacterium]|nr:hypothetical protein [Dehalococcoidia bacterium]
MARPSAVDLEERLAFALVRIADLATQLDRAREDGAARDALVRSLTDAWQTVDGRTQRHEVSVEAVRTLATQVSALEARLEQEAQLRRDALASLGQGVARDRDAAGVVVGQLGELEARLDDTARLTAGAGEQRSTQAEVLRDLDHRLDRLRESVLALESHAAAERESALVAANARAALEAHVDTLGAAVAEQDTRLRETQHQGRAVADAVSELQTLRRSEAEIRDVQDQQRALRQRVEERFGELEAAVRDIGGALLEAAEQRAQLRLSVVQLTSRLEELSTHVTGTRQVLVAGLRALAAVDDRAGQRDATEAERRGRERRETLNRIEEQAEQAAQGLPL